MRRRLSAASLQPATRRNPGGSDPRRVCSRRRRLPRNLRCARFADSFSCQRSLALTLKLASCAQFWKKQKAADEKNSAVVTSSSTFAERRAAAERAGAAGQAPGAVAEQFKSRRRASVAAVEDAAVRKQEEVARQQAAEQAKKAEAAGAAAAAEASAAEEEAAATAALLAQASNAAPSPPRPAASAQPAPRSGVGMGAKRGRLSTRPGLMLLPTAYALERPGRSRRCVARTRLSRRRSVPRRRRRGRRRRRRRRRSCSSETTLARPWVTNLATFYPQLHPLTLAAKPRPTKISPGGAARADRGDAQGERAHSQEGGGGSGGASGGARGGGGAAPCISTCATVQCMPPLPPNPVRSLPLPLLFPLPPCPSSAPLLRLPSLRCLLVEHSKAPNLFILWVVRRRRQRRRRCWRRSRR